MVSADSNNRLALVVAVSFILVSVFGATAISAQDGTLNWRKNLRGYPNNPALGQDGTVYIKSGFSDGSLYALNPDGSQKWRQTLPAFRNGGGVVVRPDSTVIVADAESSEVFALDVDGSRLWSYSGPGGKGSSPALARDGTIYVGFQSGHLVALSSQGNEQWVYDAGSALNGGPVIDREGRIYFGTDNGEVHSLMPDGVSRWVYETDGSIKATPSFRKDGTLLIGDRSGKFYAITPDGSLKWDYDTEGNIRYSATVGPDGTIYVANTRDGSSVSPALHALNPDGTRNWKYELPNRDHANRPAVGDNGVVYFSSEKNNRKGTLWAVNSDGSLKWNLSLRGTGNVAPAIRNGTLYAGASSFAGTLVAVDVSAGGLAESPWPTESANNRRTGRLEGKTCDRVPRLHVFPRHLKLNRGSVLLFLKGFEESDKSVTSVLPRTVTLSQAKPEWWLTVPPFFFRSGFLVLKYPRNELQVDAESLAPGKWTEQELTVSGELEDESCFEESVKVKIRS